MCTLFIIIIIIIIIIGDGVSHPLAMPDFNPMPTGIYDILVPVLVGTSHPYIRADSQ